MDASALASAESWLSAIAVAKLVAAALVAIGVAIEFAGEWVARPFERVVAEARRQQIAALNAQTAKANKRAEELQRENLEIRQKVAGRRISEAQHDKIVELLSPEPATFDMQVMQEAETGLFAADILKTLTDAGWTVDKKEFPLGELWTNLTLFPTKDPAAARLAAAFQIAGIHIDVGNGTRGPYNRVTIMVGGKPPPF
jgi:hypothetical protein